MPLREHFNTRGILDPAAARSRFTLTRHFPAADVGAFVQRYWIIHWDLRGRPAHRQETLPHPCVNFVVERGKTRVYGPANARGIQILKGAGSVFGVKFRPGGYRPFMRGPVSSLTDGWISARQAFGVVGRTLEDTILPLGEPAHQIAAIEGFLREHLPAPDPTVALIDAIVDEIYARREIQRVEDLAACFGYSARSLQRLFNDYVGVSPKWVIRRYRLQEAADRLAEGHARSLEALALELGYFDQAHFNRDFKALVGRSPADYARQTAPPAAMP